MNWNEEKSDDSSNQSDDEIPIWVKNEQKWVSGITMETTCRDIIITLIEDQKKRGKSVHHIDKYRICEQWRGVEQPLNNTANISDIWNAWGATQTEVKFTLKRVESESDFDEMNIKRSHKTRQYKHKKTSHYQMKTSTPKNSKTIHPKRLYDYLKSSNGNHHNHNHHQKISLSDSTEELLRLVLAQGEIIRKQLRKIRYNDTQINYHEEKAHKARMKKHGSNYLLETYLKSLNDDHDGTTIIKPFDDNICRKICHNVITDKLHDKNSDSGVVTEIDIEQPLINDNSNGNNSNSTNTEVTVNIDNNNDEFNEKLKDDKDSNGNELKILEMIESLNNKLLKEEETLLKLHIDSKLTTNTFNESIMQFSHLEIVVNNIRAEMTKNSCALQQNAIILDEMTQMLHERHMHLSNLQRDYDKSTRDQTILLKILRNEPLD